MSKHEAHAAKPEGKAEGKPEGKNDAKPDAKKPSAPTAGSPAGHAAPTTAPKGKAKGHEPIAGHCSAWSCKSKSTTFNFCPEHFDHFKFGLLKKTGEPVSDYERKFEHYTAYLAKQRARKVA